MIVRIGPAGAFRIGMRPKERSAYAGGEGEESWSWSGGLFQEKTGEESGSGQVIQALSKGQKKGREGISLERKSFKKNNFKENCRGTRLPQALGASPQESSRESRQAAREKREGDQSDRSS